MNACTISLHHNLFCYNTLICPSQLIFDTTSLATSIVLYTHHIRGLGEAHSDPSFRLADEVDIKEGRVSFVRVYPHEIIAVVWFAATGLAVAETVVVRTASLRTNARRHHFVSEVKNLRVQKAFPPLLQIQRGRKCTRERWPSPSLVCPVTAAELTEDWGCLFL